jgi:hypothetical protein
MSLLTRIYESNKIYFVVFYDYLYKTDKLSDRSYTKDEVIKEAKSWSQNSKNWIFVK